MTTRARTDKVNPPEGWTPTTDGTRWVRHLKAKDFLDAVAIVNKIADAAEALNHHPDVHIESYDRLRIETYSHDVGRLTDRDERLAQRINQILASRKD